MLTATAVVDRALQLVTVLAQATIDRADGVSVSLKRQGRISTVAWSNDTVLHMDLHQYQTGEGPCLDAMTTGHWLHSESLADEDRWPNFAPRAVQEGIASILSTPLTTSNSPVGALNIYSNSEGAFGPSQLDLLGLFAEQASGIITSNLSSADAADRLAHALVDRELIAQAQGVLMARSVVAAEEAAATLFRSARTAQITVKEQAAVVVASTRTTAGPSA
jgi:GAF domain-containing protein